VARYSTEHKEATWRRIIETAGRRLKRDGIDGSGVATLMADGCEALSGADLKTPYAAD
jgi:TetR/AcrR family transcriptional repressor of nem operon